MFSPRVLCLNFVFLVTVVCGNPMSRLRRSTSSSSGQNDGPYSTCSNRTSLSDPQLYYPATSFVPVYAFDTSLITPGNYDTESQIPDRPCPYDKAPTEHSLSESGLCPFDFYEDYRSDRIPASITKARCRPSCDNCIDPYTNAQSPTLRCKEVLFSMKALRKVGCEGDLFKYEQYDEVFPVACVCQRTVRQAQPVPDVGGLPPI